MVSWLGSAYLIAHAVVQPLSGKLTDIFGRRAGLLFCAVLFVIGNTTCGMAQSKSVMILGRVAAGLGGGGLNSVSTFVLTDLVPLRSRGMWQGLGNIIYTVGLGLGGVLGGSISHRWGWRWAFLILTPMTAVSMFGIWYFLPGNTQSKERSMIGSLRRIDFLGSLLLTLALSLMLWALNSETKDSHWRLIFAIALPLSGAILALFVWVEVRYAAEPIIPVDLLANRTVVASCLAASFSSMAFYSLMFYAPLYLQLKGYSPREVGILLLPEPVGGALGSLGSGIIMQCTGGYGALKMVVLVLFLGGPAGFVASNLKSPILLPEISFLVNGLGFGGILNVMLLALLTAVETEMQAIATAMQYAFRASGATIGISISGMVFRQVLSSCMTHHNSTIQFVDGIRNGSAKCSLREVADCSPEMLHSYMYSLRAVFLLALAFGIAGLSSGVFTSNFQLQHDSKDVE